MNKFNKFFNRSPRKSNKKKEIPLSYTHRDLNSKTKALYEEIDDIESYQNNKEMVRNDIPQLSNEELNLQKEIEINKMWQGSADYEQRVAKREEAGEEIVAERNRKAFNGVERDQLPYFETGEFKEVFYANENLRWFEREDFEAILEDVQEDGSEEEIKIAKQFLEREIILDSFGDTARMLFRNMLKLEKNSKERESAQELWNKARIKLMDYEKTSYDKILGREVVLKKVEDQNDGGDGVIQLNPNHRLNEEIV